MSEFPKKPIKSLPVLAAILRRRTRVVGTSWSRDETEVHVHIEPQRRLLLRRRDRSRPTM
jgi:hypothetical protein